MGIKGMTDRGMGFPIIGKVKKGKKEDGLPVDLDYFRVLIDENETKSQELFLEAYGEHPRELNIFLPFNEIERVWDAWLKAFTFSRQIAVSDGEYMQYLIDTNTGLPVVKKGRDITTGERVPHMEIPGYTEKGEPLQWKASGTLMMIVPELRRACYLVLYTTSVWDIIQLSDELRGIDYFTKGKLAGTKLLLKRRKQKVSCPKGNDPKKRMLLDKWLCHIEIHPDNVDANIRAYQALAMPAIEIPPQLETGVVLEGNDDEEDEIEPDDFISNENNPPDNFNGNEIPEYVDGEFDANQVSIGVDFAQPSADTTVIVDQITGEKRPEIMTSDEARTILLGVAKSLGGEAKEIKPPYSPEVILEKFLHLANEEFEEDTGKPLTAAQKSQLRYALRLPFVGQDKRVIDEKSKAVLYYLTGVKSTTNQALDLAIFRAIYNVWLKCREDSGGEYYLENKHASVEAEGIVEAVEKE